MPKSFKLKRQASEAGAEAIIWVDRDGFMDLPEMAKMGLNGCEQRLILKRYNHEQVC